jgi:ankyrin repeat protein
LLEALLGSVDITTRNEDGAIPLHLAAGSKRPDGLALLLSAAPDLVNTRDEFGWTPLHYLCDVGGPARMFELLLGAGADPRIESTQLRGGQLPAGSTPLDVARHWNDADAIAGLGG